MQQKLQPVLLNASFKYEQPSEVKSILSAVEVALLHRMIGSYREALYLATAYAQCKAMRGCCHVTKIKKNMN